MRELTEKDLFVEVPTMRGGQEVGTTNRKPTPEEAKEALTRRNKIIRLKKARARLDGKIAALEVSCPHLVCYDTAGWPYDSRDCAGCDKCKGLV